MRQYIIDYRIDYSMKAFFNKLQQYCLNVSYRPYRLVSLGEVFYTGLSILDVNEAKNAELASMEVRWPQLLCDLLY